MRRCRALRSGQPSWARRQAPGSADERTSVSAGTVWWDPGSPEPPTRCDHRSKGLVGDLLESAARSTRRRSRIAQATGGSCTATTTRGGRVRCWPTTRLIASASESTLRICSIPSVAPWHSSRSSPTVPPRSIGYLPSAAIAGGDADLAAYGVSSACDAGSRATADDGARRDLAGYRLFADTGPVQQQQTNSEANALSAHPVATPAPGRRTALRTAFDPTPASGRSLNQRRSDETS
jgi:hypothetical protein